MKGVVLLMIILQTFSTYKSAEAAGEESGLKLCAANDPDLNACVKETSQKLMPLLEKGLPAWNIPPLDPMHLPAATFSQDNKDVHITINYKDVIQRGTSKTIIDGVEIDLAKKEMLFHLRYPVFSFEADYESKGEIYGFQVHGKGRANITVWDGLSDFYFKYHVDQDRIIEDTSKVTLKFNKIYLDYSNMVVNDDPELSASAGSFINENSAQILDGFKPQMEEFYAKLTSDQLKEFFSSVPYSILFKGAN